MLIYLKTNKEIEGFKKAGKIAANILKNILSNVKPGVTTLDLDNIAMEECKKASVIPAFLGYYDFPAAICASNNKELVHGIPNSNPLETGDILSIDLGVNTEGYIGDTAESICVGSQENNLIITCRNALKAGINAARPGNKLEDISIAIEKVIKKAKYKIPRQYGGHGIDRHKLHGDPFVANTLEEAENLRLYPGMVIAIEPMLIDGGRSTRVAPDKWTVIADGIATHCEHTILITDGDPVVLTAREEE